MGKADRLLFILNLIRTRRNLTAKDLAKECGVSERTIYRDINAISSANIPIFYEEGYRFLTGTFLPTLNLSTDEYIALCLGLYCEAISSTPALKEAARRVLVKIESSLPENIRDDYLRIKKEINQKIDQEDKRSIDSYISELLKFRILREDRVY